MTRGRQLWSSRNTAHPTRSAQGAKRVRTKLKLFLLPCAHRKEYFLLCAHDIGKGVRDPPLGSILAPESKRSRWRCSLVWFLVVLASLVGFFLALFTIGRKWSRLGVEKTAPPMVRRGAPSAHPGAEAAVQARGARKERRAISWPPTRAWARTS